MILRGDEMEDIGNLQKIFHVYEERYHKAEKMGIDESSPFYAAMKEIECRYEQVQ